MYRDDPRDSIDAVIAAIVDALPHLESLEIALGQTGLAFSFYALIPDDNYHFREVNPGREWLHEAEDLDVYGALEALGAHGDVDLRGYGPLKTMELWALSEAELAAERPVIVAPSATTPLAGRLVSAERSGLERRWRVVDRAGHVEAHAVTFSVEAAKSPAPVPRVVTVRPRASVLSADAKARLDMDVLRWAPRQFQSKRVLAYELDAYLATGARALGAMASLVPRADQDEDTRGHLERQWAILKRRRRAAVAYLAHLATVRADGASLRPAAQAFGVVVAALEVGAALHADAWRGLVALEEAAFTALAEATQGG